MKKKIETRGRKALPAEKVRKYRAICWLDDAQKSELHDRAKKSGRSESALLLAGLVASGVLSDGR